MENKRRVTIQGVAGCFHDAAARAYFGSHFEGEEIETVPCDSFPEMMRMLDADASLLGIMAIENTIAGALLQNHELLRKSRAVVVGEHKTRISHVLAALPGQSIDDLTEVNSHPMALMQCEEYLRHHPNLRMVEKFDTAGSAREIAESSLRAMRLYAANMRPSSTASTSWSAASRQTSAISRAFSCWPTRSWCRSCVRSPRRSTRPRSSSPSSTPRGR